jgi:hypothetical protein
MRNFVAQLTLLLTPKRDCGADGGARTHNLRFRRPLLYPLSYARIASTIAYARRADKYRRDIRILLDIRSESPLTSCLASGIIPFRSFQDVAHPRRCERRSPLHHQSRLFTCAPAGASFMRSFSLSRTPIPRAAHSRATPRSRRFVFLAC